MANKTGLQMIGWFMGGLTAAVMLIAAILVHEAVANPTSAENPPPFAATAPAAAH